MLFRINICFYVIFHTLSGYSSSFVGDEIELRKDLEFIENLVCTSSRVRTSSEKNRIFNVVKERVKDANIILKIVRISDPSKLESFATSLAKRNNHFGLLFGLCSQDSLEIASASYRGWVVSVPSPVSLNELKRPRGLAVAKDLCKELKATVMLTPKNHKSPSIESFLKNLEAKNDYSSSITCKPRFPRWLGPLTWFTFRGNLDKNPVSVEKHSDDQVGGFLKWWQAVRRQLEITAILPAPNFLNNKANILASSNKIAHDHDLLQFVGSKMPDSWELLGENRARGSLAQIVENFWNSPNHRSLLLDSNATHGTIWFNSKTKFWVILTYRHRSKPLARK